MTTHINADILHLIADGEPVQWRRVSADTWQDYAPDLSPVNPLIPDARIIWRPKPAEVEIAGVQVPAPLPVDAPLIALQTYYIAGVDQVRSAPGDSGEAHNARRGRILHSTFHAASAHSHALQQLNVSFFR